MAGEFMPTGNETDQRDDAQSGIDLKSEASKSRTNVKILSWLAPNCVRDITINIVAAVIYSLLLLTIGMMISIPKYYREWVSDRDLRALLGVNNVENNNLVVVYPTFTSIIDNHAVSGIASGDSASPSFRYRSLVRLDPPYNFVGPDEVVAARDLLGIKHILTANNARLARVRFERHSRFDNPSEWPDQTIIAIGGPATNLVAYHCVVGNESSEFRFDTTTRPFSVFLRGVNGPIFSADRDELDYGFIYRVPNPNYPETASVLLLFGLGSPGTEAACRYALRYPGRISRLLDRDKLVVLRVSHGESATPKLIELPSLRSGAVTLGVE